MASKKPPVIRERGYLVHFDAPGLVQGITFRLADAMPASVVRRWRTELESMKELKGFDVHASLKNWVEAYLDQGYGACLLSRPAIARLVQNALQYFDGVRYSLIAWVIMPNHVHVIIEVKKPWRLGRIVGSWKSYSAVVVNKTLRRSGRLWQREYYDRYIRDWRHLQDAIHYVEMNPVEAGLCMKPEDWRFSSAARHHSET